MKALQSMGTLVVVVWAVAASAQAPPLLPLQGSLADSDGNPVDGSVSMAFALYSDAGGTTELWSETQSVDVAEGLFAVYLGDDTALDLGALAGSGGAFLGITVEGDAEMPLIELGSSAYAGFADTCGQATALDASAETALRTFDACEAGNAIRAIGSDGTVTCEAVGGGSATTNASQLTSGTLSTDRYSAAADLTAEGLLDGAQDGDILTRAQNDTRYLSPGEAHAHVSADIDAYADLVDSGRLDNTTGTAGDTDLLTRLQADTRYLNVGGGDVYVDLGFAGFLNNDADGDLLTRGQVYNPSGLIPSADINSYDDLGDEGHLNLNEGSDLVTRDQADARYAQDFVFSAGVNTSLRQVTDSDDAGSDTETTTEAWDLCFLSRVDTFDGANCAISRNADGLRWDLTVWSYAGDTTCSMRCINLD